MGTTIRLDSILLNKLYEHNSVNKTNFTTDPNIIQNILKNYLIEKLKYQPENDDNIIDEKIQEYIKILDYLRENNSPYVKMFSMMDDKYINYLKNNPNIIYEDYLKTPQLSSILSIDIRKSTELMLKANTSDDFSNFITDLIENMILIIKNNYGIIEKFTGDGILAFFPEFYSGTDSCGYAINSALECHDIFNNIYKNYWKHFIAVVGNAGLGIGIDYGEVLIKHINNSINIIGKPVVYACRMGSIDAGKTAINIPAYESISNKINNNVLYPEYLDLKTGEKLFCYLIKEKIKLLKKPDWL